MKNNLNFFQHLNSNLLLSSFISQKIKMHKIHFEIFLHSINSLLPPPRPSFVLLSNMDFQGTIRGMFWWMRSGISAMESRRESGVEKKVNRKKYPKKSKAEHLKKQWFSLPNLYPGKRPSSSSFQRKRSAKNGEKRSAESTPLITSSSVPKQPEFSNMLTHLQELYSMGKDIPFQLVLYKVYKITKARPKRNCHCT